MTRLVVPAQQARPGPPLSPVLGQQQIKVQEFVTRWNSLTLEWTPGIPLGCHLTRKGQVFTVVVRPPAVALLLGRRPRRDHLWAVAHFRWGRSGPSEVLTLLGTLRSCRRRLDT